MAWLVFGAFACEVFTGEFGEPGEDRVAVLAGRGAGRELGGSEPSGAFVPVVRVAGASKRNPERGTRRSSLLGRVRRARSCTGSPRNSWLRRGLSRGVASSWVRGADGHGSGRCRSWPIRPRPGERTASRVSGGLGSRPGAVGVVATPGEPADCAGLCLEPLALCAGQRAPVSDAAGTRVVADPGDDALVVAEIVVLETCCAHVVLRLWRPARSVPAAGRAYSKRVRKVKPCVLVGSNGTTTTPTGTSSTEEQVLVYSPA